MPMQPPPHNMQRPPNMTQQQHQPQYPPPAMGGPPSGPPMPPMQTVRFVNSFFCMDLSAFYSHFFHSFLFQGPPSYGRGPPPPPR